MLYIESKNYRRENIDELNSGNTNWMKKYNKDIVNNDESNNIINDEILKSSLKNEKFIKLEKHLNLIKISP